MFFFFLFSFSFFLSFPFLGFVEFKTCGATGHKGPTSDQVTKAYRETGLEDQVTVKNGIQYWEVPNSGTYKIEACGARGACGDKKHTPGRGAKMVGEFDLQAGTQSHIRWKVLVAARKIDLSHIYFTPKLA